MKRRKLALAAGFCLSFLLGTLLNLLFIPAFDPQQRQQQNAGVTHSLPGSPAAPPPSVRGELARQIRERYEELLRYQPGASGSRLPETRPLERRLMDLARSSELHRLLPARAPWDPGSSRLELSLGPLRLGCGDMGNLSDVHYLGSGYTKAVYRARLNGTLSAALKSVDFGGHDIDNCVKLHGFLQGCYRLASCKILKEMLLLHRLRHPNVLQASVFSRGVPCKQNQIAVQIPVILSSEVSLSVFSWTSSQERLTTLQEKTDLLLWQRFSP